MGLRGYIDNQLTKDEVVLYRAHVSWVPIIFRFLLFVIVAIVACVLIVNFQGDSQLGLRVLLIVILIGAVVQIPAIVHNLGVDIAVTNKRLHSKHGLITVQNDRESSLSRVDDTDIDFNSIFQRIFNYGSIEIHTIGSDSLIQFDKIAKPRLLKRAINEAKENYVKTSSDVVTDQALGNN